MTPRQAELVIVALLADDRVGVADELGVSPETVKSTIATALRKCGVSRLRQLVVAVLRDS